MTHSDACSFFRTEYDPESIGRFPDIDISIESPHRWVLTSIRATDGSKFVVVVDPLSRQIVDGKVVVSFIPLS